VFKREREVSVAISAASVRRAAPRNGRTSSPTGLRRVGALGQHERVFAHRPDPEFSIGAAVAVTTGANR
jgi:hypothetical protein